MIQLNTGRRIWGFVWGFPLSLGKMSPLWEAHHCPSMAHLPGETPVNRATYSPSESQLPFLGWCLLLSFQLENALKTPIPSAQGTVPLPTLTTILLPLPLFPQGGGTEVGDTVTKYIVKAQTIQGRGGDLTVPLFFSCGNPSPFFPSCLILIP